MIISPPSNQKFIIHSRILYILLYTVDVYIRVQNINVLPNLCSRINYEAFGSGLRVGV